MKKKKVPKILFVIRATGHFSYVQTIIESLAKKGFEVTATIDKGWSKGVRVESVKSSARKFKNFKFEWSPRREDFFRHILMPARELRSYRRYLIVKGQSDYYLNRYRKYLPFGTRKLTTYNFINRLIVSRAVGFILEMIESHISADKKIVAYIKKINPDAVIVTPVNMRKSEDIEFLKAAKQMGIPTAASVLTWDNLTTKGLIYVIPDSLLVWSDTQKQEAIEHHNIPKECIKVIGSPFFDKWFKGLKPSLTKRAFCRKIGLDPNFPIILYLGSSNNIVKDEDSIVTELRESLDQSKDNIFRNSQIIIRPHPATITKFKNLNHPKVVVYPAKGVLASADNELEDYLSSLIYSDVITGVNTSGMIDAIIVDKPVFAIFRKEYEKTQEQAQHFKQLIDNSTIEITKNDRIFLKKFESLLRGNDAKKQKRKEFVLKFIRPLGIGLSAGEVGANEIEKLALKQ